MSSFIKSLTNVNPFKSKNGSFWKSCSSDASSMINPSNVAANIIAFPKERVEQLVIKSGAFQEKPGEKDSIRSVAFVVGSIALGYGGVQLLESSISNGHTWLLIPCIAAVIIFAIAGKR